MMVRGVDDAFCGVGMEVSRKRLMVLKLLRKRDPRGCVKLWILLGWRVCRML